MMSDPIDTFLLQAAAMLQAEAVNEAPVVTGRLRGDIDIIEEPGAHEISVGNTLLIEYAKYVYYGTMAHTIKPKRKKALKTHYGTFAKVRHPGTKANPYLDRALERMVSSGKLRTLMDHLGDDMGEEIFEQIEKGLKTITVK